MLKQQPQGMKRTRRAFVALLAAVVLAFGVGSAAYANPIDDVVGAVTSFFTGSSNDESSDAGVSTQAVEDYTVTGVSPRGTTINVFDYWITSQDDPDNVTQALVNDQGELNERYKQGINADHTLKFGAGMGTSTDNNEDLINRRDINYWTGDSAPRQGIVSDTLTDGYPTLSNAGGIGSESLAYLFDNSTQEGKAAYMDVDGLLQVDDQGYYYYNSQDNFAQFNADGSGSGNFTLYNRWGVEAAGSSPDGQFFPFNTGDEVFDEQNGQLVEQQVNTSQGRRDLISTDEVINHYFGLNMSTRFIQQNGGYTAPDGTQGRQQVTYNFSGDDDVWIYIDGVLVGDLGGIHDATSIEINFATGRVYIYDDGTFGDNDSRSNNNEYDQGETLYNGSNGQTIAEIMRAAGVTTGLTDTTFADDTYHTLDFFYLERGNTDSNMSLKYNLVNIPESGIVKVDQYGDELAGVQFTLSEANSNYEAADNNNDGVVTEVSGRTDSNGEMIFTYENNSGQEMPITLEQMGERSAYWILEEAEGNETIGYRNPGTVELRFSTINGDGTGDGVLLSSNQWETGAYSQAHVTATAPTNVTAVDNGGTYESAGSLMFAVVAQIDEQGNYHAVTGDAFAGWSVADATIDDASTSKDAIVTAAKASGYQFLLGSGGAYQVTIDDLPGDINTYEYMIEQAGGDTSTAQYAVKYYWSDATSIDDLSSNSQIVEIDPNTGDGFERIFSVTLSIPNIKNELSLVKTDETTGDPIAGVVFNMYEDKNGDGTYNNGERCCFTGTTGTDGGLEITSNINNGEQVLAKGEYVLVETVPSGYVDEQTSIRVIVDDDGVHVDAGDANDNVTVETGIGSLVYSMRGFAAGDDVDSTLHDVVAQAQTADSYEGASTAWDNADAVTHYQYDDQTDGLNYIRNDNVTDNGDATFIADAGWSRLDLRQCTAHAGEDPIENKQNLGDQSLNALFTGDVTIHVTNSQIPTTSSLTISKTVTGTGAPSDVTFDFSFSLTDAGGNSVTGTFSATTHRADGTESTADMVIYAEADCNQLTLRNGESVTIDGLPISANYTVTEEAKGYYTPSVQQSSGTLNEDGSFTATGTIDNDGATAAFSNDFWGGSVDYDASIDLTVSKVMTGRDMTAGEFAVVVDPINDESAALLGLANASENKVIDMPAANDGVEVSVDILNGLNDIAFTAEDADKTFTYTVYEQQSDQNPSNGVTYDTARYSLTIEVSVDADGVVTVHTAVSNETGTLREMTTTPNSGGTMPVAVFNNSYNATGELGGNGSASIKATKVLENDTLAAGDFTFNVAAVNSNGTDERVEATTTNGTNGAASAADIVFPAIQYDSDSLAQDVADGYARARVNDNGTTTYTYLYRVYEDTSGFDGLGLTTSQSSYNVTVWVTDDGDGSLEVEVGYPTGSENGITFTNVYGASANATLNVGGTKIYETNGLKNAPSIEGKYTFTLTGVDEDGNAAPLPGGATGSVTAQNQANGTVDFGTITYDIADLGGADSKTFTYTVTESGGVDGVTNDGAASTGKTFTVTLTDNGKGTISVDSDALQAAGSQFSFTNEYSVDPTDPTDPTDPGTDPSDPTTAALSISKVLTGRAMNEGEFSFTMAAAGDYGNAVSPTSITATNMVNEDGTGSVVFGDGFVFTEPGTYHFTISEDVGTLGGVSYDGSDYTATAVVTDDGAGNLSVAWTVADAEGNAVSEITFENTYTTSATTPVELKVSKELQDGTLADGQFTFELTGSDGAPMPESTTVTNNAQGVVSFGSITFDAVGEYDYTVTEVNDGQDGITYDEDATRTIHVSVTDDGEGHLVAEVTYGSDGSHFVNVNTTGGNNDGGDNGDGGNGGDNGGTGDAGNGSGNGSSFAQTNDATPWPLAMALALVAAGAIIAAVFGLRRAQR
ncbi:Spy0128 family protein [Slackia equolifaciens]|uniref:Spy0128 family protein n=1 Tax=Slackia equolifaciens TaxID=498718 RepID=UPI001379E918|nr:FctA domain-containing protein [Slackia equolifaciens]